MGETGGLTAHEVGHHGTGTDRVHRDAVLGALQRGGARQADHAVLRGHIGGFVRRRHETVDARDVDDPSAPAGDQMFPDGLRRIEHAVEIDRANEVVPLFGKFGDRRDVLHAGVVHQMIERAEVARRRVDRGANGEGIAHVAGISAGRHAVVRRDLPRRPLGVGEIEVGDRYVRAGLRERLGAGATDAARAAGDERDTLVELDRQQGRRSSSPKVIAP